VPSLYSLSWANPTPGEAERPARDSVPSARLGSAGMWASPIIQRLRVRRCSGAGQRESGIGPVDQVGSQAKQTGKVGQL
jgi:hypothetical protein